MSRWQLSREAKRFLIPLEGPGMPDRKRRMPQCRQIARAVPSGEPFRGAGHKMALDAETHLRASYELE